MLLTAEQILLFKKKVLSGEINMITFDLETSISQFYSFSAGKQYVDPKSQVDGTETKIMSAQYMQSLTGKPKFFAWEFNTKTKTGDDSDVVRNIVEIVNKADIVVGQNSDSFDIKVLQERAKLLRLPPVTIDFSIDTLKNSRRSFRTISHSLDARSKQYKLGGKHRMYRDDWIDIVEGKVSVLDKMIPYGLKDVKDDDKILWLDLPYYNFSKAIVSKILRLIEWGKTSDKCPHCEKTKHKKFDVFKRGKYLHCNNCEQQFLLAELRL
jgi:hypothetical protein